MGILNPNSNEYDGAMAVVTGGSRGIGKAICLELASLGANVAFIFLKNESAANETLSQIKRFKAKAQALKGDVSDYEAVQSIFSKIYTEMEKIDILVNCAGITMDKTIKNLSSEGWASVLNTNLTGYFNCTKFALDGMRQKEYGRIINISSMHGLTGSFGQSNYSASKSGIIGLTKSLALETAKYDITANVVCPGYIETDMASSIPQDFKESLFRRIPKGRFGTPEEVARMVSFIASPKSGYITGQVFGINGGMYM